MKPTDYTSYRYLFLIFNSFMRVSKFVLARSGLYPFFIYGIIHFGPKTDLVPVAGIKIDFHNGVLVHCKS